MGQTEYEPTTLREAVKLGAAHAISRIRTDRRALLQVVGAAVVIWLMIGGWPTLRWRVFGKPGPTVFILAFDGFRHDYLELFEAETPNMRALAAEGARVMRVSPVFPTKTNVNRASLLSGLYPESHGVINNHLYDPELDLMFHYNRPKLTDTRFWGNYEVLWATAGRQGALTAAVNWNGSFQPIRGWQPTYVGLAATSAAQTTKLMSYFDYTYWSRPTLLMTWYRPTDVAGHWDGLDTGKLRRAVQRVDTEVGRIVDGLKARGVYDDVHIVLAADHGFYPLVQEPGSDDASAIRLEECMPWYELGLDKANIPFWSPVIGIFPFDEDHGEKVLAAARAGCSDHMTWYRKAEIPPELHFSHSVLIPPIVGIADEGYIIPTHERMNPPWISELNFEYRNTFFPTLRDGRLQRGDHGVSQLNSDLLQAFGVVRGPKIIPGTIIHETSILNFYELFCHLADIRPSPNNGTLSAWREALID